MLQLPVSAAAAVLPEMPLVLLTLQLPAAEEVLVPPATWLPELHLLLVLLPGQGLLVGQLMQCLAAAAVTAAAFWLVHQLPRRPQLQVLLGLHLSSWPAVAAVAVLPLEVPLLELLLPLVVELSLQAGQVLLVPPCPLCQVAAVAEQQLHLQLVLPLLPVQVVLLQEQWVLLLQTAGPAITAATAAVDHPALPLPLVLLTLGEWLALQYPIEVL